MSKTIKQYFESINDDKIRYYALMNMYNMMPHVENNVVHSLAQALQEGFIWEYTEPKYTKELDLELQSQSKAMWQQVYEKVTKGQAV